MPWVQSRGFGWRVTRSGRLRPEKPRETEEEEQLAHRDNVSGSLIAGYSGISLHVSQPRNAWRCRGIKSFRGRYPLGAGSLGWKQESFRMLHHEVGHRRDMLSRFLLHPGSYD